MQAHATLTQYAHTNSTNTPFGLWSLSNAPSDVKMPLELYSLVPFFFFFRNS